MNGAEYEAKIHECLAAMPDDQSRIRWLVAAMVDDYDATLRAAEVLGRRDGLGRLESALHWAKAGEAVAR